MFAGMPLAPVATGCAAGSAIALIRPHEITLLPGPGSAAVKSAHAQGPLTRVHRIRGEQAVEVLCPEGAWTPAVGETCTLYLLR
jgi:hypothetical protein